MNTVSLHSLRQPATLSLASMLVAAGAVAISVVAITTDDVVVPDVVVSDRVAPLGAPSAAVVRSDAPEFCRPPAPNVGLC